jgi:hypothetical protein
MKNVSAYTASGDNPPFIIFSSDGRVIHVMLHSGEQNAEIDIPLEEWSKMFSDVSNGAA